MAACKMGQKHDVFRKLTSKTADETDQEQQAYPSLRLWFDVRIDDVVDEDEVDS